MKKFFALAVLTGISVCAMPIAHAQDPHHDDAMHRDHRDDHRNDHRDDHRNDHHDDRRHQ
jgi:hypothetical protein